jgi:outer membrane protein OmpA-like peptidoglycan-associated protein
MNSKLMIGMSIALAVGACASIPPPNAALVKARSTVGVAEADPNVNQFAALDLQSAKSDLAIAEAAAAARKEDQIDQPAYLATQAALLAQAHAAAKADDARVAAGQAERDQIRLAARTREVNGANAAANAALSQRDIANAESARSEAESARLQAQVDQLNAKATSRGLVLTLGDVLFDTGKADLNSGAGRKLDQLAQFLTDHPDRRVQIDGFTDSVGTDSYNLDLSQRRADAVKSALLARNIEPARVSTQGYAKAFPVATNAEAGGRQLNRRVEVVIGAENNLAITPRT